MNDLASKKEEKKEEQEKKKKKRRPKIEAKSRVKLDRRGQRQPMK